MCLELADLEQFASETLTTELHLEWQTHLASCVDCAARLDEVRRNLGIVEPVRSALRDRSPVTVLPVPERLGSYRIIREIGRGGMGIVYEAHQPRTERLVALKVLHHAYKSDDRHERLFQREARALARLRHPAIAAIYDAGRADDGRPFLVMERVEGRSLLEYARHANLNLTDRLRLFIRTCEPVIYAHQRGVIHRDLKPGNILIEAKGHPKVLDFGLARILRQDDNTAVSLTETEPGRVFGTIPYMSPEQVIGASSDIDIRSEVYTLGIILYQLLTDRLPYELDVHNVVSAARVITEHRPIPASTYRTEARGDLDTILLKTLEKDPDARYASVSALVEDLERFLGNDPILARVPSLGYQLRKLVRRHKLPFAFAGALVLLILVFGVVAGALVIQLRHEQAVVMAARDQESAARRQADHEKASADSARRVADDERSRAEAVNQFLQDMLAAVDPTVNPSRPDVTLREVLDGAAVMIAGHTLTNHPAVIVALETTIGNAYRSIGQYDTAEVHLRRAVSLGRDLATDRDRLALTQAMNKLARLSEENGRYEEAETLFREALSIRKNLLGPEHFDVSTLMNNLGLLLENRGRTREAETLLNDALELRRRALQESSPHIATSLNNLALVRMNLGYLQEAESLFRESLSIEDHLGRLDHPHAASTRVNLAAVLNILGHHREAEDLLRASLATFRQHYPDGHYRSLKVAEVLGNALCGQGRHDEADACFRASWESGRLALGDRHPRVVAIMTAWADLRLEQSRLSEAESLHRDALETRLADLGEDHPNSISSRTSLGEVLLRLGRCAEAEPILQAAVEVARIRLPPTHWETGRTLSAYGECLDRMGRHAAARAALLESFDILSAALGPDHPATSLTLDRLVQHRPSSDALDEAGSWRAVVDCGRPSG